MPPLETAIRELRQILTSDCTAPEWRWHVRLRLSQVKEALSNPQPTQPEAWLAARTQLTNRQRYQLQGRVSALATGVMDRLDASTILHEVRRLQTDLEHFVQREHDLVYDSVSLEIGGSE